MPQPRKKTDENPATPETGETPATAPKMDRAAAIKPYISALFDEAFELNEEYEGLIERRRVNREALRSNVRFMDADERALLEELHPERNVQRRTPEERAAALEAQARKVREAAEKAAAETNGAAETAEPETTTPEPEPAAA